MISDRERVRRYRRWTEAFLRQLNDDLAPKGHLHKRTFQATVLFHSILLNAKHGPEPPSERRKSTMPKARARNLVL